MTDEQQQTDETQTPWIERGSSLTLLYRLLIVICLGLLIPDALDLLHIGYHKHIHYSAEGWFAFYSIFGFIAYSLIVGAGFIWRRVVMRDEDYYA
mgnify:FL=1